MKVFRVNNNRGRDLVFEGRVVDPMKIRLKEDVEAAIGSANGLQQARLKASQIMNKNSNVTSASADAGHLDNQNDASSGEGLKLQLPINANNQQLSAAQQIVSRQNNDDMEVEFTKNSPSSSDVSESYRPNKAQVTFTKREMDELLKTL